MNRALWLVLVSLLVVDVVMLVQRRQLQSGLQKVERQAAVSRVESRYAAEEETLLISTAVLPPAFPRVVTSDTSGDSVQFFLFASVDDCTNCVEDEVMKLNELSRRASGRIAAIRGYFINEQQAEMAQRLIQSLSPAPLFPMAVKDTISRIPHATTPLVLVVRSRDGKILDAHKPVPADLRRRDAFYARWSGVLGLS